MIIIMKTNKTTKINHKTNIVQVGGLRIRLIFDAILVHYRIRIIQNNGFYSYQIILLDQLIRKILVHFDYYVYVNA